MATNKCDANTDTCCFRKNFIVPELIQRAADVYTYTKDIEYERYRTNCRRTKSQGYETPRETTPMTPREMVSFLLNQMMQ